MASEGTTKKPRTKATSGVVYRIYKLDGEGLSPKDCYVGSTTNFVKRKCIHKSSCNAPQHRDHNRGVYQFIRANGGWDAWAMEVVEKVDFGDDEYELGRRENHHIAALGANLNKNAAPMFKTKSDEYREHHNAVHRKRMESVRDDPEFKEKKREQDRAYREKLGKELLERKREARKQSPERFRAYEAAKYEKHRDEILERQKAARDASSDEAKKAKSKANYQRYKARVAAMSPEELAELRKKRCEIAKRSREKRKAAAAAE